MFNIYYYITSRSPSQCGGGRRCSLRWSTCRGTWLWRPPWKFNDRIIGLKCTGRVAPFPLPGFWCCLQVALCRWGSRWAWAGSWSRPGAPRGTGRGATLLNILCQDYLSLPLAGQHYWKPSTNICHKAKLSLDSKRTWRNSVWKEILFQLVMLNTWRIGGRT